MGDINLKQLSDGRFSMTGDVNDIEVMYEVLLMAISGVDVPSELRYKASLVEKRIYKAVLMSDVSLS